MSEYTMGAVEMRFAEIIWEHEPVSSGELVKLCEQELNWKIIEESFAGSLPDFVAAFTSRKKLSKKEIKELKKIIENNGGAKE